MVWGKHNELRFLGTEKGGLKALPVPLSRDSLPSQKLHWQETASFNWMEIIP